MLANCDGFAWDERNSIKNWEKYQVSTGECEQVFFNNPLVLPPTQKKDFDEPRFVLLSQSDQKRLLTVVFTVRKTKISVISAREMSRRERRIYVKKNSEIQR